MLEDRLQALAYLMNKDDILSGWKAFCIGKSNWFLLQFQLDTSLMLKPIEDDSNLDFKSIATIPCSPDESYARDILELVRGIKLVPRNKMNTNTWKWKSCGDNFACGFWW
jgi:hypothetical protein